MAAVLGSGLNIGNQPGGVSSGIHMGSRRSYGKNKTESPYAFKRRKAKRRMQNESRRINRLNNAA